MRTGTRTVVEGLGLPVQAYAWDEQKNIYLVVGDSEQFGPESGSTLYVNTSAGNLFERVGDPSTTPLGFISPSGTYEFVELQLGDDVLAVMRHRATGVEQWSFDGVPLDPREHNHLKFAAVGGAVYMDTA